MTAKTLQRPGRLSNELARRLREEISGGTYDGGGKLPTEAELSRDYGVSRSVVREAVALLRSDGLVESRQGSGVYVLDAVAARTFKIDPSLLLDTRQLAPVFELRIELEKTAAGMAARRRTRRQMGAMRSTLAEIAELVERGRWGAEPDYLFHVQIAEAAHNPCLRDLLDYVTRQITASVALRRRQHPPSTDVLRDVQAQHEEILAAIAERDPARAQAAIAAHLHGAAERLGLGLEGG